MSATANILLTIGFVHNISMIIIATVRIQRKDDVLRIREMTTNEPEEKEALQKIKKKFHKSTIAFFAFSILLADILLLFLFYS